MNSWSPFKTVAELPPCGAEFDGATILSFRTPMTGAFEHPNDPSHFSCAAEFWFDHPIAVLWDEDHDERVLDWLAHLIYNSPYTASKVSAIHEYKGGITVWLFYADDIDWQALNAASESVRLVGDIWPVELRELHYRPITNGVKGDGVSLRLVHTNLPSKSEVSTLWSHPLSPNDKRLAHINALYPLGWWGQPKRTNSGSAKK